MCSPMIAMVGLQVVGSAVSAAGQVAQGKQAEAMANLQAQAYEQQAENERRAAAFESMQEFRKQELASANARAQVGASGVAFEGSPSEALVANAGQGQLDIEAIQYGSSLKQSQLRTQGAIAKFGGQQAKQASYIAGASTLISGVGSAIKLGKSPFS